MSSLILGIMKKIPCSFYLIALISDDNNLIALLNLGKERENSLKIEVVLDCI